MIKEIIGWIFYFIGTPFHKLILFFNKYVEQATMAAEIPCVLVLLYSLYKIIADGSYIGESSATTVLYLLLLLGIWILLATFGFAVYSLGVMIIFYILFLVSLLGDIIFEFGKYLLDKREEQGSQGIGRTFDKDDLQNEKIREKEREEFWRMYREANAFYTWEKTRKERERHDDTSYVHVDNIKENELQRAKLLFGVSDTFTYGELKASRNQLMRKYHPDNQEGNSAMARKVNEYYEFLLPYARKT